MSAVSPKIREIQPDDAARLGRLFTHLSPHTIYLRFFSPVKVLPEATLRHLAAVDHDRRQAFVGTVGDEVVGVARYERDPSDPSRAELAIVVADDWQHRGLGTALLDRLSRDARRRGVEVLTATVLGENLPMLTLARRLAPQTRTTLDHGEWSLEIPVRQAAA